MSEMVERVAKAMGSARISDATWDQYAPEVRDDLLKMACAAIMTMREPSAAMRAVIYQCSTIEDWRWIVTAALEDK